MNSPTEPASPTFSTPSSESPPPEDNFQPPQNTTQLAQLTTQIAASLSNSGGAGNTIGNIGVAGPASPSTSGPAAPGGSSSKRRQPHGISVRDRDAKSRRREPRAGASMGNWESQGVKDSGGKKDKDDFVDTPVVEKLRKGTLSRHDSTNSNDLTNFDAEIGDPFME